MELRWFNGKLQYRNKYELGWGSWNDVPTVSEEVKSDKQHIIKFECGCGNRVEVHTSNSYFCSGLICIPCGRQMYCNWTPRPEKVEKTLEEGLKEYLESKQIWFGTEEIKGVVGYFKQHFKDLK